MGIELGRCLIVDQKVDQGQSKVFATVNVEYRLDEGSPVFDGEMTQKVEIPFKGDEHAKFTNRRIRRSAQTQVTSYFEGDGPGTKNIFEDIFDADEKALRINHAKKPKQKTMDAFPSKCEITEDDLELDLLFDEITGRIAL